jgi:tRNA(Ser,Leu) C12 N-acetylase TAN1
MKVINGVVELVGSEGHSVNLGNPEIVILIEIFKVHRHSRQNEKVAFSLSN